MSHKKLTNYLCAWGPEHPSYIPSVCETHGPCFLCLQACKSSHLFPIVLDFVVKLAETIYLQTYESDQNWADHAVAFICWDMIMNQWSIVFYLWLSDHYWKMLMVFFMYCIAQYLQSSLSVEFNICRIQFQLSLISVEQNICRVQYLQS